MYCGYSSIYRVCSLCPGYPPLFLSLRLRRLRRASFFNPALESGLLLLRLFLAA